MPLLSIRRLLQLCLFTVPFFSHVQSGADLSGSWVRVLETGHEAAKVNRPSIRDKDYLKLSFGADGEMKIYASYVANGIQIPYHHDGQRVSFGVGRQFRVEKLEGDELILLDLIGGEITAGSSRHYYLRESVFLDALPNPEKDRVIMGSDTAYIASKKLYPIFQTTNTPDFHIFIHNQIKSSYRIGENYFHATFMIRPDGSVDYININHRVNKGSDKKAIKAILASAGRWHVPKLNGRDVNIIMTIEDLFTRRSESPGANPLKIDLDYSTEDPEVYTGYFNLAIRSIFRKQPQEALQYLKLCEERRPEDPNLHYLRYLTYDSMGNAQAAEENLVRVRGSRLRYLLK